ncbi:MAG TPA: GlsB/YeaQ/YmgE family stress response membrane protein [Bosea sp. (in: a-proteobacteria)]|nr:GlsB/YeaQ/YmgE family stress response membrane protein [Bosea sp. (in: a-proteobacteria)]HEV2509750.1 GlsB/YeaQ/YmgE family stress response membrane protein [Bosea sp. (in: a-proteobacteria)]
MAMDLRALLVAIAIGAVAGWLASIVMGGGGLIRYIITGLIGAFVGSFLLQFLGISLGIGNPLISQIITATIGAIVVVFLARLVA